MSEQSVTGKSRGAGVLWLWTLCLGLLALLGIAVWVMFPVWEVRVAVEDYAACWSFDDPEGGDKPPAASIMRLGGAEEAAQRLTHYLKLPDWIAPRKPYAARFMRWCDEPGVTGLRSALTHPNSAVRHQAAEALRRTHADATPAIPELELRLNDDVVAVRRAAAYALSRIAGRKLPPDIE